MQCEVCGRTIRGKHYRIIIEGAKMIVCSGCSQLSSSTWHPAGPKPSSKPVRPFTSRTARSPPRPRKPQHDLSSNLELVEGFPTIVREARERLGLDHVTLGRKIGEKVSALQKIEAGRFSPDIAFAKKLEHELKVQILTPPKPIEYSGDASIKLQELTLGDMISTRKKDQRSGQ